MPARERARAPKRGDGGGRGGGGGSAKPATSAAGAPCHLTGDSLAALTHAALQFRDEREWKQFHNFKDLAITLTLESAEVLEHAQWKTAKELEAHLSDPRTREDVADELADVLHVLLLLAEHAKIDLAAAFHAKLTKTAKKYPVEKARGSAKKYDEL